MSRRALLAVLLLAFCGASWIDPHATAREAARLYADGNFNGASSKYNEALVEDPDSTLLHYNLGASVYREGKYEEAITAYGQTPTADVGEVAYNVGNASYRLGVETEASDPQKALTLYAQALAAYRRAMGADPNDADAKFNHEFVTRKMAELQKKLDEEKKKQQEQQQQQDQQQQEQQQQPNDQQQADQSQQDQQEQQDQQQPQPDDQQQDTEQQQQESQDQPQADAQQQQQQGDTQSGAEQQNAAEQQQGDAGSGEAQPQTGEPGAEQPGGEAVTGEPGGQMTEREAQALLDAARDQEARPEEVAKRMQRARVLEPAEDW